MVFTTGPDEYAFTSGDSAFLRQRPYTTKIPETTQGKGHMKALVLSAGFGTRLRPHSLRIPKPMFPVWGQPIIDIIIRQLVDAGAEGIAVNTHHLADQVETFLAGQPYARQLVIRREKRLLGTGGAVGNFADFLSGGPFVVINSDILCDIDIRRVYREHKDRGQAATLVMHDHPSFNKVAVDESRSIRGFSGKTKESDRLLAFTGISVIDPAVYRFVEPGEACCIIDIFRKMIAAGETVAALAVHGHYWNDLGTPERFRDAVVYRMLPEAITKACPEHYSQRAPGYSNENAPPAFRQNRLAGDGSDRKYFRVEAGECSLVLADHGIHTGESFGQADAFATIGRHLGEKGMPVPEIYGFDRFSGLVLIEDAGDIHLQDIVLRENDPAVISGLYRKIIDELAEMSVSGKIGFDTAWAYQGACYDRELIIEKECLYFTQCLVKGYLQVRDVPEQRLMPEFQRLSGAILENAYNGLMHRDFQSRNILVKNGRPFFIDFQGARIGPVQYDLASLLADPYVNLGEDLVSELAAYAGERVAARTHPGTWDTKRFFRGYRLCCISRLMQALGAYGFLVVEKGKAGFERYISVALERLARHLEALPENDAGGRLEALISVVSTAEDRLAGQAKNQNTKKG